MDRVSYISYVLHQSTNEKLKKFALDLLNGTITLREVEMKSPLAEAEIKRAQLLYKNGDVNFHHVYAFVAEKMNIAS